MGGGAGRMTIIPMGTPRMITQTGRTVGEVLEDGHVGGRILVDLVLQTRLSEPDVAIADGTYGPGL